MRDRESHTGGGRSAHYPPVEGKNIKAVEFLIALKNNQGTPKRINSRVSKIGTGGGWWGKGKGYARTFNIT